MSERDEGATPLIWAAAGDNTTIIRVLVHNGADVGERSDWNSTALHSAAFGNKEALTELLEQGADANALGNRGQTPLVLACNYAFDIEIVKTLLQYADPNLSTRDGATALQSAAFRGRDEVVKLLIEHGAEVNARGYEGATALHWAVDGQHQSTVALLLENGAAINAKDDAQTTPLGWAQKKIKESKWNTRKVRRIAKFLVENKATE